MKEQSDEKSSLFFPVLAFISLIGIGYIVFRSVTSHKTVDEIKHNIASAVLGEKIAQSTIDGSKEIIADSLQSTVESSKVALSQKAIEIKDTVIESVQKEVGNLTQSQIEALKIQICKDLGVILSPTPTASPSAIPTNSI